MLSVILAVVELLCLTCRCHSFVLCSAVLATVVLLFCLCWAVFVYCCRVLDVDLCFFWALVVYCCTALFWVTAVLGCRALMWVVHAAKHVDGVLSRKVCRRKAYCGHFWTSPTSSLLGRLFQQRIDARNHRFLLVNGLLLLLVLVSQLLQLLLQGLDLV